MEIKNRQKYLLIAAGAGLLLLLGNSFVYNPLVASWAARTDEIKDLRGQLGHGTNMVNRSAYILGKWANMQTNALPADSSVAEAQLQRSFERWERQSGVTRVAYKPQWKDGDDDDYKTLECRVEYTGNINGILSLLFNLEKDPLGLRVDDVEIASRDDNGRQLSLNLQVSGLRLVSADTTQPK